ncbi:MAG: hypothetical protein ABIN01_18230 [Ferruginibacter sp.]
MHRLSIAEQTTLHWYDESWQSPNILHHNKDKQMADRSLKIFGVV